VPLFLLMSNVLLKGGVGGDLFAAVHAWVGHWPGGLAVATIISCGIFAAISGSSVATAATIGTVAIPEMINRGYERRFVYGLLAAGGTLGILIPPSIPMIVYGFITEESVIALFLAGIGPGLLLVGLFIVFSMLHARFITGQKREPAAGWAERRRATLRALPALLLAVVVIGVIYTGAATPTEAAAIGFAAALAITAALGTLTWKGFREAAFESMATTAAILLIVAGAKVFGKAITLYRIPQDVSAFIGQTIDTPLAFIVVVSLVLLLMGLVFEALSMVLIMTPVLLPAAMGMRFDPVWFGVYMVIMVECALITPPVGLNLYVIQSVAGRGHPDPGAHRCPPRARAGRGHRARRRFAELGADILFVEAPKSVAEMRTVCADAARPEDGQHRRGRRDARPASGRACATSAMPLPPIR
jgi:C4-dicarboxylate transporter DctM subunit